MYPSPRAIILLVALPLACTLVWVWQVRNSPERHQRWSAAESYAVLLDAGSTGTRVHVFSYTQPRRPGQYPDVRLPSTQHKVTPGLSTFAPRGEGVEESLMPLIQFAREQVPARLRPLTPIRLLATAGLRMLPPAQAAAVLDAAAAVLAGSGFAFERPWARILSGAEEGLFAWAGVNYAAGRLQALAAERGASPRQRDPAAMAGRRAAGGATLAVLELGGASMQATLMPHGAEDLPPERTHALALPGVERPLYTHSFLGYGLHVAWFRAAMLLQQEGGDGGRDPCLHPGYEAGSSGLPGSGSFQLCARLASQMLAVAADEGSGSGGGTTRLLASAAEAESSGDGSGGGGGGAPRRVAGGRRQTLEKSTGSGNGGPSGGGGAEAQQAACAYARCSLGGEYLPLLAPMGGTNYTSATSHMNRTGAMAGGPSGSGAGRAGGGDGDRNSLGSAGGGDGGYLILATENFAYTLQNLGLPPDSSLQALAAAGAAFCALPWDRVEEEYVRRRGIQEEYVLKLCFASAYTYTLLTQGFHIGPAEAPYLRFTNRVTAPDGSRVEANWVLGALLVEVAGAGGGRGGAAQEAGKEGGSGRPGSGAEPVDGKVVHRQAREQDGQPEGPGAVAAASPQLGGRGLGLLAAADAPAPGAAGELQLASGGANQDVRGVRDHGTARGAEASAGGGALVARGSGGTGLTMGAGGAGLTVGAGGAGPAGAAQGSGSQPAAALTGSGSQPARRAAARRQHDRRRRLRGAGGRALREGRGAVRKGCDGCRA